MKKTVRKFEHFTWIDLEAVTEEDLKSLDLPFPVEENFLEDAMTAGHLPKYERLQDQYFIIMRAYQPSDIDKAIEVGELSNKLAFFVYPGGVLTVHRAKFDFIANTKKSYNSPDELILHLCNQLFLTYEKPLRKQADKMDELEREIFLNKSDNLTVEELYYEKAKARLTKKLLLIMQNVINELEIAPAFASKHQDVKDTALENILRSEEVIDDTNSLLNSYMSFTAQKSNEVMKLLTIFSVFFLPLSFIAGLYGMNFMFMPELEWKYGYFAILGLMLLVGILIYWWFKRRKIL